MTYALQITALIFSLIMVYFALLHKKRKEITQMEFVSWSVIWGLVIVVAAFPDVFRAISQDILLTRLFDLVVIGGIAFTLSVSVVAYIRASRAEKRMEKLVRKLATRKQK